MAGSDPDLRENYIKLIESQKCICDRYTNIQRIDSKGGDGCFSLIFTADDSTLRKKRRIVLKFYDPMKTYDKYRVDCFHRESELLEKFNGRRNSRNILPLIQKETTFFVEGVFGGMKLSFPLMFYSCHLARSSIHNYIYGSDKTDIVNNLWLFKEMCKAVQYLHSEKYCHRDLKPENFLIYGKRQVWLSDFGTVRECSENSKTIVAVYTSPVGDTRYTAPELLCGLHFLNPFNFYADIYSLGVILFELFTKNNFGNILFQDRIDMAKHFFTIPEHDRKEAFNNVIDGMARNRPLPSIGMFNDTLPKVIVEHIDRLYQSMASIDCRKRETNFQTIFFRINICKEIAMNMRAYEKWKANKQKSRGTI